ncbi:MAG TPA: MFS transporter [Actinomycetota bacterium]|nr:MFS transporter [Actinomycetota bacterium]
MTSARPGATDPGLRRAALATALVFAVNGVLLASWVARLPATRDRLGASAAELGLVLLAPGVGSLLSMPFSGRWCRRFGSRLVVAATTTAACAVLVALAVVPNLVTLGLGLFVWGSFYGSWDVAMNVHGSAVEQRAGREWMPRYHACWSVGGIAGAGFGALAAHAGSPLVLHFTAVAVLCVALVALALRSFVEDRVEVAPQPPDPASGPPVGERSPSSGEVRRVVHRPHRGRVLTGRLLLVGVVTLCATTLEGAAADWLALFLTDERGATASLAAFGYAVFAVAMAAGRFSGTAVAERLGRDGAVRAGGLVSFAGVLLTVLGPGLAAAYAGAALWALGVCLVFPAAVSAGGEAPDRPADAIAAVTTIGYGGFLLGPPLIGLLADRVGLGRDGAVRAGGLVSLAGVLLTVLGPGLAGAYAGAALWALGVCLVFPAAVSAGGETPERPADAIAAVTTVGYGGFLVGPPLIGLLADRVGLGRALLVLCLLAGGIAALAPAVRSRRPRPAEARP